MFHPALACGAMFLTAQTGALAPAVPVPKAGIEIELGKAPPPPSWEALPEPYLIEDGSTCFPPPGDQVILGRLVYLDAIYPSLCQQSIDVYATYLRDDFMRQLTAKDAVFEIERAKNAYNMPIWIVVLIGAASVGLGIMGGYFIHGAVSK